MLHRRLSAKWEAFARNGNLHDFGSPLPIHHCELSSSLFNLSANHLKISYLLQPLNIYPPTAQQEFINFMHANFSGLSLYYINSGSY